MSRLVKDFIEIRDCGSLDALIDSLVAARDSLPEDAKAEVRMRGDDVFGRQISISFYRPQTAEEAECDARYAEAYRESRQRELTRLEDELGVVSGASYRLRRLRVVNG
jgi:sensor domain CHASE-containing protein